MKRRKHKMKFRAYNDVNIDKRTGKKFPTYFKTKKEAIEYGEKIGNATIEKKIGGDWYKVSQ